MNKAMKVDAGLYLFLGNDARTVFRIRSYRETGHLSVRQTDGTERVVTGQFWRLDLLANDPVGLIFRKQDGTAKAVVLAIAYDDEELQMADYFGPLPEWETVETLIPTMREAKKIAAEMTSA